MAQDTLAGDLLVAGTILCKQVVASQACLTDAMVGSAAAIQASKLQHQYEPAYAQDSTTNAFVERKVLHVVKGLTATLVDFSAGSVTPAAAAGNAVVDLLKNGVSILTAPITLDVANVAYVPEAAPGYTTTSLVAGDVLEFKVTSVAATIPKGVFARLTLREDAA